MLKLIAYMTCAALVSVFAPGSVAHAYTVVRSSQSSAEVRWPEGANLTFRANEKNSSRLSPPDLFRIFTTSLNRWKQAAFNGFSFTYYQGSDSNRYPNTLGAPQDNSIFFTSNSRDKLSCGVLALTDVWFDPSSGTALRADLRFNDDCYQFTTNPADTRTQSRVFLGDVATHEIGHALGLDHSQNLQSSMVYSAFIEESVPACDDRAAMVHLYGRDSRSRSGQLVGQIIAPNGSPIFGAHVTAIELELGKPIASTLSQRDGTFRINGLEAGHYTLLVEPYLPSASTLGPFYSGISSAVCGGAPFERTFFGDGSKLRSLVVYGSGVNNFGTLQVSCSPPSSTTSYAETNFNSSPVIAQTDLQAPIAVQSVFNTSQHFYRLNLQSGRLVANVTAFGLFSRADTLVEFFDERGYKLAQSGQENIFQAPSSGYVNYDSSATVDLASTQNIYIRVTYRGMISNASFPMGGNGASATPYYVLSVARVGEFEPLYPNDARCAGTDGFGAYSSQGEAPEFGRFFNRGKSDDDEDSGGCLTIEDVDHDPLGPSGMNRLMNFAMLAIALWTVRKKWTLSAN